MCAASGQRATWSVDALGQQGAQGREDGHWGISVGYNQERENHRARQRQGHWLLEQRVREKGGRGGGAGLETRTRCRGRG